MEKRYKKLIVWQKAYLFALRIYKLTQYFPKHELFGLTSQFRRASVSVFANIAEGYERQHRKEYVRFLTISKGSLGEIEAYISFSKDLGYLNETDYNDLDNMCQEVFRLLRALIRSLSF